MALNPGSKLGVYEILGAIGAGGFGAVYKARDTRLNRTVAIKVLSEHISRNSESRQRFEREAQAIAGLKHPNICVLYDVGQQEGANFLVMEYIEGETLANRLTRGPLSLDQALKVAIEIAGALDKAHRQGITHRDLKPGNIMLTKSGSKLLDFGLAKLKPPPNRDMQASNMPTVAGPSDLTGEGTILGTLQYMSPEQLDGIEADARSDIFAFGAVVYEMLTGRKAFEGRGQSSMIAAIMNAAPPAISVLQPMTPPAFQRVVTMCLAKDPDDRWQSTHDLYSELRWIADYGSPAGIPASAVAHRGPDRVAWTTAAILLLISAALAVAMMSKGKAPDSLKITFDVATPTSPGPLQIALSPDGKYLAAVVTEKGDSVLWVRALENLTGHEISGTEFQLVNGGAGFPFWSPDGHFLAFFADGKLKKVDISGAPPQTLCDAPLGFGGTWNSDGVIVLARDIAGPLFRVSASGGDPTQLTELDKSREETAHRHPVFLPDGKHFLFVAVSRKPENSSIYIGSLDSKERKRLLASAEKAMFAAPDHILFMRDNTLMAQDFDTKNLELHGDPVSVAEGVGTRLNNSSAGFTVSGNGVLAYRAGGNAAETQLRWFDRMGKQTDSVGEPGSYAEPLSPDLQRLAIFKSEGATFTGNIWILDLIRGTNTKFTFDPSSNTAPLWSPDGSRIIFTSNRNSGVYNLYQKNSVGIGSENVLLKSDQPQFPTDWSLDGRFILYEQNDPRTKVDLWVLPMTSAGDPGKPEPLLQTPSNERQGRFSPDEKWIAYTSDESGSTQIYVQSFPVMGTQYQISTKSAVQPRWRHDGKELFFVSQADEMMAVEVSISKDGIFHAGTPQRLFQMNGAGAYDITPYGQRFLINSPGTSTNVTPITVIINWMSQGQAAKGP